MNLTTFSKLETGISPVFKYFCKERDTVFFLGAGFCADLGLPIMRDFQKASLDEYKYLLRENNKPAVRLFLQSYEFYKDFCTCIRNGQNFIKIDPNNIEDVFCIAESFVSSGVQALKINENKWHVEGDIYPHIGFWLWKIYQQCPSLDARKGKEKQGFIYNDFFSFLKRHMYSNSAIITTNYDLICEYYMKLNGMEITYPIPTQQFRDIYLLSKKDLYIVDLSFQTFPICKLHGSINYFEQHSEIKKSDLYINREWANKGDVIGGSTIPSDRPGMFALDALSEIKKKMKLGWDVGVIPPTYSKISNKEWLKYTWNGALTLISQAKRIIFIGYSFPDSDGFMKAMFQAALSLKNSGNKLEVYVVDKDGRMKNKFRNLFLTSKVNFFKGTFEEVWAKGNLKRQLQGSQRKSG